MKTESTKWQPVIGLEVHAELLTKSKMFCSCPNIYGKPPNSLICPICTGQPGVLPSLNKETIKLGIRTALAFNCEINRYSVFARKNYFYPDLPKGYQISQYDMPFCKGGMVELVCEDGEKKIPLERIHFEEDAGKSIHIGNITKIDLNRAGVPLLEIVTAPHIDSPSLAASVLKWIRATLRFINVCDGVMEQGSLRCDANVSVKERSDNKPGTKIELKNINSFRYIEQALSYEIQRQIKLLEKGEKIFQETRLWNTEKQITETMRIKEEADDYRYFPEPDLLQLIIEDSLIEKIKSEIKDLPIFLYRRFKQDYGFPHTILKSLVESPELAKYFLDSIKIAKNPKLVANWLLNEVMGVINSLNVNINTVKAEEFGNLIKMLSIQEINASTAKRVLREMFGTGKSLNELIKNVTTVSEEELFKIAQKIISSFPNEISKYKAGKKNIFSFFIGQVMKETSQQADPKTIANILKKLLE